MRVVLPLMRGAFRGALRLANECSSLDRFEVAKSLPQSWKRGLHDSLLL